MNKITTSQKTILDWYIKLKVGFVDAFIKAFDVWEALDKLLSEFKKQYLIPVEIEFMAIYDIETEWETKEQTDHYVSLYNETIETGNVIFDTFYAYEE